MELYLERLACRRRRQTDLLVAPLVIDRINIFSYNVNMKYSVVIRKSKYGYDVRVPTLPGCHSQGDTEREALNNIKDAIRTYLEMERGELKGAKVREVEVAFA